MTSYLNGFKTICTVKDTIQVLAMMQNYESLEPCEQKVALKCLGKFAETIRLTSPLAHQNILTFIEEKNANLTALFNNTLSIGPY